MPASRIDPPDLGESLRRTNVLEHIRTSYVGFVQGLYAARPVGSMHWDANEKASEICISTESPIKLERHNNRPCITLTRSTLNWSQLGFDDLLGYDPTIDQKTKSALLPGTMVINCCSRAALESESMAIFTGRHIWLLRDVLMRIGGFYDVGRSLQITAPSPAGSIIQGDQSDEWFCTSVVSPYYFYETGSVTPLGQHIARSVEVHLRAQLGMIPKVGAPGGGHDLPLEQRASAPGVPAHKVPHPLNPAQQVEVHVVRPLRQPRIPSGARALPQSSHSSDSVEGSDPSAFVRIIKI